MVFSRGRGNGGGGGRGAGGGGGTPGRAGARDKDWVCCSKQCTKSVGKEYVNFGFRMACFQCGGSKDVCFGSYVQKGSEPKAAAPTYAELQMRRADAEKRQQARRKGAGGHGGTGGGNDAGKAAGKAAQAKLDEALKRIKELEEAAKGADVDQGSDKEASKGEAKERRSAIDTARKAVKHLESFPSDAAEKSFGAGGLQTLVEAARARLDALFAASREAKPVEEQLVASKKWHEKKKDLCNKAAARAEAANEGLLKAQEAVEVAALQVTECELEAWKAESEVARIEALQADDKGSQSGESGAAMATDSHVEGAGEFFREADESARTEQAVAQSLVVAKKEWQTSLDAERQQAEDRLAKSMAQMEQRLEQRLAEMQMEYEKSGTSASSQQLQLQASAASGQTRPLSPDGGDAEAEEGKLPKVARSK